MPFQKSSNVPGHAAVRLRLFMSISGLLLLISGLRHASQPYLFLYGVAAYQILPPQALGWMVFVPYAQVALGFCLVMSWNPRSSILMAGGLFTVFATAQFIAILRDRQISCGCFGFSETPVGVTTLVWPLLGLSACVLSIWSLHRLGANG